MNININRIVIPVVSIGTSAITIAAVFKNLRIATIKRIALFRNRKHYIAYIEVDSWYANTASMNFRRRMLDNDKVPLVYDEPKSWKVSFDKDPLRKYPRNSVHVLNEVGSEHYVIDIHDEPDEEMEMDSYLREIDVVRSDYSYDTIGKYYPVVCNAV